jgi:hypothetical protein
MLSLYVCILASLVAGAGQAAREEFAQSAEISATPLRALTTRQAHIAEDGFFAFVNTPQCDEDGNLYFLLAPHAKLPEVEAAASAGRDLPLTQRQVLRVGADGERKVLDIGRVPKFATAKKVSTGGIAAGPEGSLYLLIWVTWRGEEQPEKNGQYIASFDSKGEARSLVEIDSHEIGIQQFEVFGSGQFLVRGRWMIRPSEPRIAILSDSGKLQDLPSWRGDPSGIPEYVSVADGAPRFDFMTRGHDGRIYVAEQDAQSDEVTVHAIGPQGDTEAVLNLQRTPRNRRLVDFRSSGSSLAAVYEQNQPDSESSSSGRPERWWIAVYENVRGSELRAVYGPAPGPPLCYQRTGSEDRFTFLTAEKNLVTMAR